MTNILSKSHAELNPPASTSTVSLPSQPYKRPVRLPKNPRMYRTTYNSLPVSLPPDFLAPLSPSAARNLKTEKVDFANSVLPEYKDHYAVVIDNVLTAEECHDLIRYAEMSAGGHGNGNGEDLSKIEELKFKYDAVDEMSASEREANKKPNGWHRALVRAGANREMLALQYRDSDRIIWQHQDVGTRIWKRVCQAEGVKRELQALEGETYRTVMGQGAVERNERWKVAERGFNESLKFLRYGRGQFFREHCDGTFETADGTQRSFYTIHLYLNDSTATSKSGLGDELISLDLDEPDLNESTNPDEEMLEGGATTFHSRNMQYRLDVHPKAGRVLIFQQKGLLHSGDEVTKGVKYTMRSDIMYEFDDGGGDDEGNVHFG